MQATKQPQGAPLRTYAHRKGRSRDLHTFSSPLNVADSDNVSLVEMTRRMKKRARQSIDSFRPVDEQNSRKLLKRPEITHAVAHTLPSGSDSPSAFPLDPFTSLNDGTNKFQYQTPFNLSPVSSPTAPDSMSPVPPRRHLSRTGSRNFKENKGVKRLASPFQSRSKPPFYIKTRTRSEANAHPSENMSDEVQFPISGSLPTLGSMKTTVCGPHLADNSPAYMLQNLSDQDWLRPAKAHTRGPFLEDYVPPGTPFQEWDCSAETFFEGVPLQTSTPNVLKVPLRRYISTNATPSAPNTPDSTHSPDNADNNIFNSFNVRGFESDRHTRRHCNHDSIFSSFDSSTTLSTSIFRPNCMNMENTPQSDPMFSTAAYPPLSGQAVVKLSGVFNDLAIDGMSCSHVWLGLQSLLRGVRPYNAHTVQLYSSWPFGTKCGSLSLAPRSRSLDSTQATVVSSPPSGAYQTGGRKRDRASTIRASDYLVKPTNSLPGGGETSTAISALTTRTRSGTIRAVRHPVASSASSLLVATPQSCVGQGQTQISKPCDSLTNVVSEVDATDSMIIDTHSEESDDELLLDGKGWNWDGRWD
ncbi:hypothetical protein F5148DRAFT_1182661 [Russula earlei]|uniref:Uncharacterized protein n=1 Tax=Russula earlei TaxID=71964 RepID=A0ACC0UG35_9AGAM|nr:hypothetical protein F5148DRAFT_1182661 [Russula earlei]